MYRVRRQRAGGKKPHETFSLALPKKLAERIPGTRRFLPKLEDDGKVVYEPVMEPCPVCGKKMLADDGWGQKQHMEENHPEVIKERLQDAGLLPP